MIVSTAKIERRTASGGVTYLVRGPTARVLQDLGTLVDRYPRGTITSLVESNRENCAAFFWHPKEGHPIMMSMHAYPERDLTPAMRRYLGGEDVRLLYDYVQNFRLKFDLSAEDAARLIAQWINDVMGGTKQ